MARSLLAPMPRLLVPYPLDSRGPDLRQHHPENRRAEALLDTTFIPTCRIPSTPAASALVHTIGVCPLYRSPHAFADPFNEDNDLRQTARLPTSSTRRASLIFPILS
jgi:hypothetical protein